MQNMSAGAAQFLAMMDDSDDDEIFDKETVVRKAELRPLLHCPLCNKPYRNATVVIECGHTFCRGCVEPHITEDKTCPKCKTRVNGLDRLQQDMVLQGLSDKFADACSRPFTESDLRRIKGGGSAESGMSGGHDTAATSGEAPAQKGSSAAGATPPKRQLPWVPPEAKASDPLPYNVLPPSS